MRESCVCVFVCLLHVSLYKLVQEYLYECICACACVCCYCTPVGYLSAMVERGFGDSVD